MSLKTFDTFLQSIDLGVYREAYRPIKLVEMDMPRNIQAIELLYTIYWDEKRFLDFDSFYTEYLSTKKDSLESFREKITMCKSCFYRGLPARIYRTWASIITQIHAGYVAESVFGKGTIAMSAELDHQGADFRVAYKNTILNYQVKKATKSREVRRSKDVSKNILEGVYITIEYEVPSNDCFLNPKNKNGSNKAAYTRFIENKTLKRLPNGFIVFTKHMFEKEKERIDTL